MYMSTTSQVHTSLHDKRYIIWYTGSYEQAEYIQAYTPSLKNNSEVRELTDSAIKNGDSTLPKKFLRYFFLDFPDIIISDKRQGPLEPGKLIGDSLPVMGIEILEQKPVGWNHIQRFPRGLASIILGVPFAYLEPIERYMFDKGKSGDSSKTYVIAGEYYKENLRKEFQLPYTLYKAMSIHKIPCLSFFWPLSDSNKFISEGLIYNDDPGLRWKGLPPAPLEAYPEIKDLFDYIETCINHHANNRPVSDLINIPRVKKHLLKLSLDARPPLYSKSHVQLKVPFGGHVKIARLVDTTDFLNELNLLYAHNNFPHLNKLMDSSSLKRFKHREKTLVCDIASDPYKGNRGFSDPYSGVLAAFDCRECRNIKMNTDIRARDANLVFMNPLIESYNGKTPSSWFEDQLRIQFRCDGLEEKFGLMRLKWPDRRNDSDTLNITERLNKVEDVTLSKTIKNFFYFCDLIVFSDTLFVGKPLII
jgi:hypothetical protein